MNSQLNLLGQVATFENLMLAYKSCRKGKKETVGDQKFFTNYPERLLEIQEQILNGTYEWGQYREFYVIDPIKRLIMAAPFKDRIVHHAIHLIIAPFVEQDLTDAVCACRIGKGNRYAVLLLAQYLKESINMTTRYAIKLDVKQYFPSIDHQILFKELLSVLPDISLAPLLWSVIVSHKKYAEAGAGIPIGNLTSQLFANFYLSAVDKVICDSLGLKYKSEAESKAKSSSFFIRYMDDFLIISDEKALTCKTSKAAILHSHARGLDIPIYKRMHLSSDPIPFLGYLVSCDGITPLARNKRKIKRKLRLLEKIDVRDSYKAMVKNSYDNWSSLKL
jgi:RNA-directed DNA polymerase